MQLAGLAAALAEMGDGLAEAAAQGAEIASPTRRRRDREETAGSVWDD